MPWLEFVNYVRKDIVTLCIRQTLKVSFEFGFNEENDLGLSCHLVI